jgi:uncharacterized membrane protein
MSKISAIAVASAVAGALALAAAPSFAASGVKCYGVSKAGQNDCANAAKTHDCSGQSKVDYDLADWKTVPSKADCQKMGGSDMPGMGMNKMHM